MPFQYFTISSQQESITHIVINFLSLSSSLIGFIDIV